VVGLSRSTYQKIKARQPTNRDVRHLLLADLIKDIHERSRGTYGMLRISAALEIEQGLVVNKKLVWKIMRQLGLKGLPGPKKRSWDKANEATEEDLVERRFSVSGPNELWLTDITEHPTREAKVYCCGVLDAFSRRAVGWALDRRCESALVNDALSMAAGTRITSPSTIIHSDHGSQFTSWAFSENVRRLGLLGSMGTVGDCYDNAPMESFWGSMQIELLNRKKWMTVLELTTAIAEWIEEFYNPIRRHSSLGYLTPNEYEALHSKETQVGFS
jgi:putative transposase